MKIKFTLAAFFLSMPIIAIAQSQIVEPPMPASGVRVVPVDQMNIPESFKKNYKFKLQQEKKKGYVEVDSKRALNLFSIKRAAAMEIKANEDNLDPQDTHLKSKISDIKLAFSFKDIPVNPTNVIGYDAVGMYKDGWTGISTFFNYKNLGTCVYTVNNMALTHGGTQISDVSARYDINDKPNTLYVEGNLNAGFVYNINWFDDTYDKELECATMSYDKELKNKLIALAKKIDKQ